MRKFNLYLVVFLLIVAFIGCERDSIRSSDNVLSPDAALRASATVCTAFNYADSIFYLIKQGKGPKADYIVSPKKGLSVGIFGAYPAGLQINASTGAINVTASETGLKYRVYYVKRGTQDTCNRYITISGIDYLSSTHVLAQGDTLLKPLYRGRPGATIPCTSGGSNADNSVADAGCEFDDGDDDDNNGTEEPSAGQQLRPQGVDVSKLSAIINLRQTVRNGVFGKTPVNGASKVFRLYYRIGDSSNKALNHIDVKFVYYDRTSDVPASLKSQIRSENARMAASAAGARAAYEDYSRAPRPPIIVIVGY